MNIGDLIGKRVRVTMQGGAPYEGVMRKFELVEPPFPPEPESGYVLVKDRGYRRRQPSGWVKIDSLSPQAWTWDGLVREQREQDGTDPVRLVPAPPAPRVFKAGDTIPEDVILVVDHDGDIWHRVDDDLWSCSNAYSNRRGAFVLDNYGPAVEVRLPEPYASSS